MDSLAKRLEAGPGSRKLSDECLLAVGWPEYKIIPGNVRYVQDRPDPSQNLQDAVTWMVPPGWEWQLEWEIDSDDESGVARVEIGDPMRGLAGEAPTPALALCIAALKAMETTDG